MPAEIWNEGRVVGYSAYEIYVKQFFSQEQPDPAIAPASERQWLASSLAMGSSLLLRLPVDNPDDPTIYQQFNNTSNDYYFDIPLPTGSKLIAANTLIGSFFNGVGVLGDDSYWAESISSYGDLIPNNSTVSPSNSNVPVDSNLTVTAGLSAKLQSYIQIVDGVVYLPQSWTSTNGVPAKEINPNFSAMPHLRLHIKGIPTAECWILLTGFTLKSVIFGESLQGVSTNPGSNLAKDGGFLGPAVFPWSSKIVFTLPSAYHSYVGGTPSVSLSNINYSTPSGSGAGSNTANQANISVTKDGVTTTVNAISLNLSDGTEVTISTTPNSAIKISRPFLGYDDAERITSSDKVGNADLRDNITWAALLAALSNNQSVDILGESLSKAKHTLRKSQAQDPTDVEGGRGPYLEFGRGDETKRFYISKHTPSPEAGKVIPEGSIGIGWGMPE